MRKFLLLAWFFLPLTAAAQDYPSWELFGGYQFTRADIHNVQDSLNLATSEAGVSPIKVGNHLNANGWNLSVQENKADWFGGVVDISGAYAPKDVNLAPLLAELGVVVPSGTSTVARFNSSVYTFAGGPQFTYRRNPRYQPFARIMFGAAHARVTANALVNNVPVLASNLEQSDTNFALIMGGGIDYHYKEHLAVRAAGDYIRTYLFTETQNNFRLSIGLVYRWNF